MSCKIIAEAGINHNGSIELAKELIKVVAASGADIIKFQKRDIESVYSEDFLASTRDSPWGTTQRAQKEGLELSIESYRELYKYCKELKIEMMVSCWDIKSQILMRQFNFKYNKVASPMLAYTKLLQEIASERKYTYISTGMSDKQMIMKAVDIFRNEGCEFELMHCVSIYPLKPSKANLNRMLELKKVFSCNVGYSGHEVGLAVTLAAASLGASSIERHLTLDRSMYGSDQSSSLEPDGLKRLVRDIKTISSAMGNGELHPHPEEQTAADKLRAHIQD